MDHDGPQGGQGGATLEGRFVIDGMTGDGDDDLMDEEAGLPMLPTSS